MLSLIDKAIVKAEQLSGKCISSDNHYFIASRFFSYKGMHVEVNLGSQVTLAAYKPEHDHLAVKLFNQELDKC